MYKLEYSIQYTQVRWGVSNLKSHHSEIETEVHRLYIFGE